jgi:hypothetical protein
VHNVSRVGDPKTGEVPGHPLIVPFAGQLENTGGGAVQMFVPTGGMKSFN